MGGKFESCFKQRDESTVNRAKARVRRNLSLSTSNSVK
jgi:hypothetical protein